MHPIEIDETLKTFGVIVDTREQKWAHVEDALKATDTPYERRKLDFGDYSCTAVKPDGEPVDLSGSVVIERKANFDELAGNLTKGRARFDREFRRALACHAKVFLLVENSSWEDIKAHRYRSMFPPKSFAHTLLAWQARYNITIVFCKKESSGEMIKGILWFWLRDYLTKLKGGDEFA
jgi:ERCC4-type nuclease